MKWNWLTAFVAKTAIVTILCVSTTWSAEVRGPISAEESLRHFQLAPGLKIEIAAAEPEVLDPIEIRFDEFGRMWVVEMGDYPFGPKPGQTPVSRIRILEDKDGDGRFETSNIFADQLLFATGIQPWDGGVIVTLAGEVAFFKDTNGDGKADLRETWYKGFAQENSQLRANHPRLGLDGFIYVANGLRGGAVVDARHSDRPPVPLSNLDFRFHPASGQFEALTGVGQFGLTFDDFGNRFICSNRNPLMHIVLEDRFVKRNKSLAIPELRHDVAKAGEVSRVYAISRAWTTSNLHAGQFTAACGALIYRGNGLPAAFYGAGFTCDPTGNLVHCEILKPDGATFTSSPEREGVEFLASPDEWFRPVNCESGPDGSLYVVDMYRAVIEHPDFVPDELKRRPDQMLGTDRGRIYRIRAAEAMKHAVEPLGNMTPTNLASTLTHANGWHRDTARRLLLSRHDEQAVKTVRDIASSPQTGREASPGRVAAMWTLQAWGDLSDELVLQLLKDADPRVREQAVAASESRVANNPELRKGLAGLATDADDRVRFQVALLLAPVQTDDEAHALARIAKRGRDDVWTRRAVALSAADRAVDVLTLLLKGDSPISVSDSGDQALLGELSGTIGASDLAKQREFGKLLFAKLLSGESGQSAASRRFVGNIVQSWMQSLARSGKSLESLTVENDEVLKDGFHHLLGHAESIVKDRAKPDGERIEAMELLVFHSPSAHVLTDLASSEPVQAVRVKAISLASRRADLETWKRLVAEFGTSSPAVRRAILDGSLARGDRIGMLFDAMEAGKIKVSELDQLTTTRLVKSSDAGIRARAEKLLASAIPADRQKVLADYQAALQLKGDAQRGKQLFTKNCAQCHRIGDVGVNVAPDISDSRVKTAAQYLTDILQPNRAIDNNYISYVVTTTEGDSLVGIISAESANSVTIKMAEGKTVTLLRNQIDQLKSTGVSLMPEGLEKNLPAQEMADLLSFVKNWRYLDGRTPFTE